MAGQPTRGPTKINYGEEIAMKLFKRAGGCFQDVAQERFADDHYESQLEEWIYHNPELIADDLMMIGRQVVTRESKRIDLLALNREGHTVIVELKRGDSPRDLQAQIDEYLSAVEAWSEWELGNRTGRTVRALQDQFRERFHCDPPAPFNTQQTAVVVVEDIDENTLRTFRRHGTRALRFSYYRSGEEEYVLVEEVSQATTLPPPPVGKRGTRARGGQRQVGTDIAPSGMWLGQKTTSHSGCGAMRASRPGFPLWSPSLLAGYN
jgi:hypothetical protein